MKYEVGQNVETPLGVGVIFAIQDKKLEEDTNEHYYKVEFPKTKINFLATFTEDEVKPCKSSQERLFDLGFEKVAKHKYVKHHKGSSGYDTSYKITIEFAFNMYQVKCECENWLGVDLELSRILTYYLEELQEK